MAKAPLDLRSLARSQTAMGVRVMAQIATTSENDSARVAAINSLWDRGWGKANTTFGDGDGGPLQVTIRHIVDITRQSEPKVIEHEANED